jgi:hypothetical protein
VSKGSGTTRGDRRRNARRERLRAVLPRDGAVIGIDLAEDKQAGSSAAGRRTAMGRSSAGSWRTPDPTRSLQRMPRRNGSPASSAVSG